MVDDASPVEHALLLDDALLTPRLQDDPEAWTQAWQSLTGGVLAEALAWLDDAHTDSVQIVATGRHAVRGYVLRRADRWHRLRRWRAEPLAAAWATDAEAQP